MKNVCICVKYIDIILQLFILAPHLGHLYTAVVADAIQRFEKLTNPDCHVIFSTGIVFKRSFFFQNHVIIV